MKLNYEVGFLLNNLTADGKFLPFLWNKIVSCEKYVNNALGLLSLSRYSL